MSCRQVVTRGKLRERQLHGKTATLLLLRTPIFQSENKIVPTEGENYSAFLICQELFISRKLCDETKERHKPKFENPNFFVFFLSERSSARKWIGNYIF